MDEYYGEHTDEDYEIEDSPFGCDIRQQAIENVELFFIDKKYWAGGNITKRKLYTTDHINTVLSVSISDALEVAYKCLEEQRPQSCSLADKNWEIKLCYETLKSISNRYIPKCFAGGILLVYLSLCQGIDYLEELKKVNPLFSESFDSTI